jgi:hypothetical protein
MFESKARSLPLKEAPVGEEADIRNDISTNAQTLKHNINNVCNLIKLKQAI